MPYVAHKCECKSVCLLALPLWQSADLGQTVSRLAPNACWDRLQPPSTLTSIGSGWIDIFTISVQRMLFPIQSRSGRKWKSHWAVLFIHRPRFLHAVISILPSLCTHVNTHKNIHTCTLRPSHTCHAFTCYWIYGRQDFLSHSYYGVTLQYRRYPVKPFHELWFVESFIWKKKHS